MICFCVHEMVFCHFTSRHSNSVGGFHVPRPPEQKALDEIVVEEHGDHQWLDISARLGHFKTMS